MERHRLKNKELGHDMTYGVRNENERINKVVEFNSWRDPSVARDTSMLHFPKWKHDTKETKERWASVVGALLLVPLQDFSSHPWAR